MGRYIFILVTILFAYPASAQVANQDVVTSAGGYNSARGVTISWTLGETIVPTFSSSNSILTQGFQQQLVVTPLEENLETHVRITIFPNPASDIATITFNEPVESEIRVLLLNAQGQLVKTDFIEPSMVEKQIDLKDIPGGIYFIRLTEGKLSNVYKVVKL